MSPRNFKPEYVHAFILVKTNEYANSSKYEEIYVHTLGGGGAHICAGFFPVVCISK